MAAVGRLMESLRDVSEGKDAGLIPPDRASLMAVRLIRRTRDCGSPTLQRKPLDHLELICANGWIREAVAKVPTLYPYLGHPDLWVRGRGR